ncbi:hypothetical protein H7R52_18695 [Weissella confusa]|uniref:Uncharacterized protein n=1 Tax=Weissella confusa TaxID=1583 RepID=A0A923NIX7_WEICO|nr:hypothetical protein [Weissella confusa]
MTKSKLWRLITLFLVIEIVSQSTHIFAIDSLENKRLMVQQMARADADYGQRVADAIGVDMTDIEL